MTELFVGVGQATLHLRHCVSLKDKRRVLQGLIQKLRNEGFSVTENAYAEEPKRASVGYAFAGSDAGFVKRKLQETDRLFVGDYLLVENKRDVFDYGGEDAFSENPYRFLGEEEGE